MYVHWTTFSLDMRINCHLALWNILQTRNQGSLLSWEHLQHRGFFRTCSHSLHLSFDIWVICSPDRFDCRRENLLGPCGSWVKESFVSIKNTGNRQSTICYAPQIEHRTQWNPIEIYLIVLNKIAHVHFTQECCDDCSCCWNIPVILRKLVINSRTMLYHVIRFSL